MEVPKILIVDDELAIRQAMRKALKKSGYELLYAENGAEGLALLEKAKPTLIFLDLRMPVLDGFGFLEKIRIKPEDPYLVIAITGHGDDAEVQKCYELGVNFFLRKPLSLIEVSCLADRCIEMKRLETEIRSHRDDLQIKVAERTKDLQEQLHFQQNLIDSIPVPVFFKNTQLSYLGCNKAYEKFTGLRRSRIIGKTVHNILPKAAANERHRFDLELMRKGGEQVVEISMVSKGVRKDVVFYKAVFRNQDQTVAGLIGTIIDLTARKRAEEKVLVKSHELEEANTALKLLFRQMKKAKEEIEDNILCNLRDLVLPYLEQMSIRPPITEDGMHEYKEYLGVVKANLDKVTSTFHQNLSSRFLGLSPREIQVADLIKKGKTNKDMGRLLAISMSAVEFHRDNLRKKLKLKYRKKNLRSYLLSLD